MLIFIIIASRNPFGWLFFATMALSKLLMDRLFTYETLVHAVSGAAGATVAMSVFYPLDTIRSRLQVTLQTFIFVFYFSS